MVSPSTPMIHKFHNLTISSFTGIPFLHLSSPMPFQYRAHKTIPRGVSNRRAALQWIAKNNIIDGVLYFGDDDNSFSLKLFSEIRTTKKVSMFPVGLIGLYSVSSPIVENVSSIKFNHNPLNHY